MREIKFRAYDIRNKRMIEWAEFFATLGELKYHYLVDNVYPTMEYTGLKDKNGKEIYEGDIVEKTGANLVSESYCNPYPAEIGDIFFVQKLDSGFTLIRASRFGCSTLETPNIHGNIDNYALWNGQRACEVIGNIYENEELLE